MAASVTAQVGIGDSTIALTTLETGTLTPTGSNKAIYVLVGSGASSPNDPSAVKYASTLGVGGESLTLLDSVRTINVNVKTSVWRLANPSAASGTIHVTWGGSDDERWIIAVAVQDAAGTEGVISYATANNATNPSVTPATTSGELVLDFISCLTQSGSGTTLTVGAGQTSVYELEGAAPSGGGTGNIGGFEEAGISRETAAGSSTVMSWTIGSTSDYGIHAFQVNGAAASAPAVGSRRLKTPVHPGAGPYNPLKFKRSRRNTFSQLATIVGSGSDLNKGDLAAGSGSTTILGTAADRPGSDRASGTGTTTVLASGSGIEKGDRAAGSGSVGSAVDGSGSAIVGNDSSAGTGTTTVVGAGVDLPASDRASGVGTTTIVSFGAAISGSDQASGSGNITILGSGAAIAGNDSAFGSGTAGDPIGTGSAISGDDVGLGFGTVPVASGTTSGGAVIVDVPKKKRKKSLKKQIEEITEAQAPELTEEQVKGMEAVYGAQMRQAVEALPAEATPEAVEELAESIIEPFEIPPSVFAEPEPVAHDPQQPAETEEPENLEDEIALIMAIIEAIG